MFDSRLGATTFKATLAEAGVIFCSFSEAVQDHPELVREVPRLRRASARQLLRSAQLGGLLRRLVCATSLRACAARWSCRPTFRINAQNTGQFERTLIVAEDDSHVSYLEGCTAPQARREPASRRRGRTRCEGPTPRSSTPRFRTGTRATRMALAASTTSSPSADAPHADAKISWTQVETGSAITWKYPSVILQGDRAVGEFYSVA